MKTRKNHTPEATPAETFAKRDGDIARLIDVLEMEMDKRRQQAKAPHQLARSRRPRQGPG